MLSSTIYASNNMLVNKPNISILLNLIGIRGARRKILRSAELDNRKPIYTQSYIEIGQRFLIKVV